MKKIRNLVLILALFMCFNGCEKSPSEDSLLQNDAELTIEQAKSFVGQQSVNQFTLKSGNLQKTTVKIKADWGKAKSSNNRKISVVETPILTLGGFGFATPEAVSAYETTQNVGYLNSVSKLVVLTYKKTGAIVSFIMTIVGNKSFMEKRKFTLLDQTYLTRDKELTGFVFYHSIDGKFVNGWQYVGGKVVGKIGMNDDDSPVLQLKSTYYINYYTTTCVTDSWVQSGAGSGIYGFGSETTCTTTLHTNSYTIYDTNNNTTTIDWIQAEESGSTGVYVPACPPTPKTDQILRTNYLDPIQTSLLENALSSLINESCMTQSAYNMLVNNGIKLDFKMNTSLEHPASYGPTSKSISFRSNSDISSANLKEEIFHAAQDAFYPGGTAQYTTTGKVNIEFEAKLYKDIEQGYGCCYIFQDPAIPYEIRNGYTMWVESVRDTRYISNSDYQKWTLYFNQYHSAYSSTPSANLTSPSLLNSIISQCLN
jgi:hypothetical protein